MNRSTGFLTIPIAAYAALGAALVILGLGAWGWVEKSRYEALKADYDQFRGGVKALGLAAKKTAAEKEAADLKRKEQADAEHEAAVGALNARIASLRARRAGAGSLPAAPACPGGAAGAAEFRAEYQRAYGALITELRGLGDECAKAIVDLDAAKRWAQR